MLTISHVYNPLFFFYTFPRSLRGAGVCFFCSCRKACMFRLFCCFFGHLSPTLSPTLLIPHHQKGATKKSLEQRASAYGTHTWMQSFYTLLLLCLVFAAFLFFALLGGYDDGMNCLQDLNIFFLERKRWGKLFREKHTTTTIQHHSTRIGCFGGGVMGDVDRLCWGRVCSDSENRMVRVCKVFLGLVSCSHGIYYDRKLHIEQTNDCSKRILVHMEDTVGVWLRLSFSSCTLHT